MKLKNKIQNMEFKKLLTISFVFFMALILILGLNSVNIARNISNKTKTLYDRPHTNLVSMMRIKASVARAGSSVRDSMLTGAPVTDETRGSSEEVTSLLAAIEANKVDSVQARSADMIAVSEDLESWASYGNEIITLLDAGKKDSIPDELYRNFTSFELSVSDKMNGLIRTASQNAQQFKDGAITMATISTIVMIVMFILALIFTLGGLSLLISAFKKPMSILEDAAHEIAVGNLHTEITYESKNEFGRLADTFREMADYLQHTIVDISTTLQEMGNGDFQVKASANYIGEFSPILDSMEAISNSMSSIMGEINHAAENVSSGADQISAGAQMLSESSTDQSASIEELSATITNIADQVTQNASFAKEANIKVASIYSQIEASSKQMEEMTKAMTDIEEKSAKISEIVTTIDGIASQTNLLSLNASIEAARAGELGKGFAVVANEVKDLANKSTEATKDTNALIVSSIEAVKSGTAIAGSTSAMLTTVNENAGEITKLVENIAQSSSDQAQAISQITMAVDQITDAVQNASASSQQSAASSEELAAQSQMLKILIQKFKIREL